MIAVLQFIAVIATIAIGVYALVFPNKIEGFTGLKAVGGRGVAEIRAIFGGIFIGMGVATFLLDKKNRLPHVWHHLSCHRLSASRYDLSG